MANLNIFLLTALLPLLSTITQNIEKAFLQNNPKILYSLFSHESSINISLPEPISFSDQLSNQQAYFLFQKIFTSFTTLGFYPESELPPLSDKKYFIFKTRWSFKDNKNNNLYVIHVFFLLMNEEEKKDETSLGRSNQKKEKLNNTWKIIEIKAEKI